MNSHEKTGIKSLKRMKVFITSLIIGILSCMYHISAQELTAKEIVTKADQLMKGESNKTTMTMTVVRPTWKRTITFKTWVKGSDFSLALVTSPAKEKGQTFLKRQNEMWTWNPKISRLIKMPPSMLSQGWMGSDFTNDDLLKESSLILDYKHSIETIEDMFGYECYKIVFTPLEDAAVVWGKLVKWISKDGYFQIKTEYFDEDGYLVKTEIAKDIKQMDDRKIPTYFELIPADEEGNKTIVVMNHALFNIKIPEDFFSQQNMKRVR